MCKGKDEGPALAVGTKVWAPGSQAGAWMAGVVTSVADEVKLQLDSGATHICTPSACMIQNPNEDVEVRLRQCHTRISMHLMRKQRT